ncbi:MAG: hypothetical protein M0001_10345 [Treponema sp.]|nr:hypothetical protein [Treponema sp.]
MKKLFLVAATVSALVIVASCASAPPPKQPELVVKSPPYDILQTKGTLLGMNDSPSWVIADLQGGEKAVEKLPDYQKDYVVVVGVTGKDLEATQMAAGLLDAQTQVANYLSRRVKETFSGAQVGDKDKLETYMERVVKSVSEVQFSGFQKAADWWVQLRWYKDQNKRKIDHDEYRVFQLYTIDKDVLQTQFDKILADAGKTEAQMTPDKQKAMDLVNQAMKSGF